MWTGDNLESRGSVCYLLSMPPIIRPTGGRVLVHREPPETMIGRFHRPTKEGSPCARVIAASYIATEGARDLASRKARVVLTGLGSRIPGTDLWVIPEENVAMEIADDLQVAQPADHNREPWYGNARSQHTQRDDIEAWKK